MSLSDFDYTNSHSILHKNTEWDEDLDDIINDINIICDDLYLNEKNNKNNKNDTLKLNNIDPHINLYFTLLPYFITYIVSNYLSFVYTIVSLSVYRF